ncbi:MAG: hypothetical protein H7320_14165 [Ferruginibacter sp.]|nr:hypothetical protein [Ferruginibacter sp.]
MSITASSAFSTFSLKRSEKDAICYAAKVSDTTMMTIAAVLAGAKKINSKSFYNWML